MARKDNKTTTKKTPTPVRRNSKKILFLSWEDDKIWKKGEMKGYIFKEEPQFLTIITAQPQPQPQPQPQHNLKLGETR